MAEQPPIQLLTIEQAAEILAVSKSTVKRLLDRGDLPYLKVCDRNVRIPKDAVNAYVMAGLEAAQSWSLMLRQRIADLRDRRPIMFTDGTYARRKPRKKAK